MKIVWLLAVLAACGGSKPAPAAPPAAAAEPSIASIRAKMEQLSNDMCNCHDAPCAQRVADELARWRAGEGQSSQGRILAESDTEQLMPIAQRMATCMANAMTSDSATRP